VPVAWFPSLLLVALIGLLGVWLRFGRMLVTMSRLPNLARGPEADPRTAWPRLSVVVACRNEEAAIRAAISSLLDQDYPNLEVVAVDDRSEDRTGALLDQLARERPALRVAHLESLPAGWLGKTNALQHGAAAATGEWLLFTDADILFAPGTLRRAVAWAVRDQLGHAVALPHFVAPGFLERGFVSFFGMLLLVHLEVNSLVQAGSRGFIGVGAFNLVRRDAYEAIGGHTRLRLEVADDVKLGLLLRRSGVREGAADSGGLVRVRWQRGFFASMRGLLKNSFAGNEFRWRGVARSVLGLPLATTLPAVCLLLPTHVLAPSSAALGLAIRLVAAAALLVPVVLHGATARRVAGGRGHEGLLVPIAGLCLAGVMLTSALLTKLRGAVIWRGTRYPLDELEANCVREDDWPPDRAPGKARG
jgi:Glycosyl transferase family 2